MLCMYNGPYLYALIEIVLIGVNLVIVMLLIAVHPLSIPA